MTKIVASVMLASFAGAIGGCDESSPDGASVEPRKQVKNAPTLNGSSLNGSTLNGVSLNGVTVNGVTVNGVTVNGVTVNGFTVNGSLLSGLMWVEGVAQPIAGTELIGAKMTMDNGEDTFILTFDDIRLDAQNPAGDVYLYDVSVYDPENDVMAPLCQHNGAAAPAILMVNHWDSETGDRIDDATVVTFACRGGAIAKCVDWGYRPWATATECDPDLGTCSEISLTDHHQACTRMVRNDYCGNGVPHTVNGTLIDVYDRLSPTIQTQATANYPEWGVEAEWGPDGALCAGTSLRLQHLDELGIPYDYPSCLDDLLAQPDCGSFPVSRGARTGNSYCGAFGTDPKDCG